MKILATTCYTGSLELCEMTQRMIDRVTHYVPSGVRLFTSVFAQGAHCMVDADFATGCPENVGFSFGMNRAIDAGCELGHEWEPDYILCLNNDLEFPHKKWLNELVKQASSNRICVPATDRTAIRIQAGPKDLGPIDLHEMSAYCWLVPFKWCQWLKEQYGYWLFDEEFESYGSDNWAAFLFSKKYGATPFRYVRRSWVKHLRGRTAAEVKPDRKKSNRTLVDKLKRQLEYPNLRPDLRKWAHRYIKILTPRC